MAGDLRACQVQNWLPKFRALTYQTSIIELPDEFVTYLLQDGVHVATDSAALPTRMKPEEPEDEDSYQDWSESDEDQAVLANHDLAFPELLRAIDQEIERLGGAISPSLDWSCPKDAIWVTTGNTHRCCNANEAISRDAGDLPKMVLALRKWHALRPEGEFRCFVRGHQLVGVSQRNIAQHFPGLQEASDQLSCDIEDFFEENLMQKFSLQDYVFDCYVTSRGKVKLIDFSPVGGATNPLLFSWQELGYAQHAEPDSASRREDDGSGELASSYRLPQGNETHASDATNERISHSEDSGLSRGQEGECESIRLECMFRVVEEENRIQPNMPQYGVPYDMIQDGMYEDLLDKLQANVLRQASEP